MATRRHGEASFLNVVLLVCATAVLSAHLFRRPPFCNKDQEPLSFLWAVKRDPPSYFFGTIHVPYTRVWDHIPENAKQAFESCDNVFFELDLLDPFTVSVLAGCQLLPQGENLSDVLPHDLFRRLKRHLDYVKGVMPSWMTADQRGRGLYADYLFNAITGNWERKRPVWVMLMVNSLTEGDVKSRGIPVLDLYLAQEAERMKKRTGAVEMVEEQCLPLNGLNLSQVLFSLNHTLIQHEGIRMGDVQVAYTTDDLIKHYNCGDLNAVVFTHDTTQVPNLANCTMTPEDAVIARNIDAYFRRELIYKRNMRMGGRVVKLLSAYPDQSFFFAFGAGHFLGNNTVLDFVQAGGFRVEHVPFSRKIRGSKKTKTQQSMGGIPPTWGHTSESAPRDGFFDGTDTFFSFHRDQAGRRQNRRRPAFFRPVSHLTHPSSTSSPPTSKPRRFNELWVRLDSYSTRSPYPISQDHSEDDVVSVRQALHMWYGIPSDTTHLVSGSGAQYTCCPMMAVFVLCFGVILCWRDFLAKYEGCPVSSETT